MEITTYNYSILSVKFRSGDPNRLKLEAISVVDRKPLGYISLKLKSDKNDEVQLSKISTYYSESLWPRQTRDCGNNGVGTRLLLEGARWASDKGRTNLVGEFVPEKEFYRTKEWYEKRSVFVSDDLQKIAGYVPAIIASCQDIIARYL